jgi:dTMP kinase
LIKLKSGILIAFEGIDGAGKTTQVAKLVTRLTEIGFDVERSYEPTDLNHGELIHEYIKEGRILPPEQETKLFIEDRKQHVSQIITPYLNEKKIVVLDRYFFANAAYQGIPSIPYQIILEENRKFAPEPDIVFLLDIAVEESLNRITNRKIQTNHYEKLENLKRVRDKYLEIKKNDEIANIKRIDGMKSIKEISDNILEIVLEHIDEKGLIINVDDLTDQQKRLLTRLD